jgi:hypothetical protein
MTNRIEWCFAWNVGQVSPGSVERAALPFTSKWMKKGMTVTVSFLDDEYGLEDKIIEFAMEWTNDGVKENGERMANIHFNFQQHPSDPTHIRISFKKKGNWSAIGTTCQRVVDTSEPTMNFGNLKADSTDEVIRRAVLHEFGHALGLIHEHQNPVGGIKWNRTNVYRDLMLPPNKWTQDEVDKNMFYAYERDETNFTAYDSQSIMIYPIPKRWTTDSTSVAWNTDFSAKDRDFIRGQYP